MSTVFVYHRHDHEGALLADVLRWLDHDGSFQFLPIETPQTLDHLSHFWHTHQNQNGPIALPLLVLMTDTTGMRPDTHRVVRGPDLHQWFRSLLTAAFNHHPDASEGIRTLIVRHLSPPTLIFSRIYTVSVAQRHEAWCTCVKNSASRSGGLRSTPSGECRDAIQQQRSLHGRAATATHHGAESCGAGQDAAHAHGSHQTGGSHGGESHGA